MGYSVTITATLPFSWCAHCTRQSLETEQMFADGAVFDQRTGCRYAEICEAAERARKKEMILKDACPAKTCEGVCCASCVLLECPQRCLSFPETCHGEKYIRDTALLRK